MDELISRQAAIEDIRTTIPKDARFDIKWIEMWLMQLPSELGTNLASLGTDCISRQDAIDVVQNRHMMLNKEKVLLINDLEKLPSAEPKRGRWISADAIFGGVPFYCSECGENTRDTVMGKPRWNFCPNCGAKMEVNHESN